MSDPLVTLELQRLNQQVSQLSRQLTQVINQLASLTAVVNACNDRLVTSKIASEHEPQTARAFGETPLDPPITRPRPRHPPR